MKRNKGLGSAWGSILAMQAGVQAQEAAAKPRVVKTEAHLRQEEFDRIKREHDVEFVQVSRPATAYEKAIDGRDTVTISVPRKQYEDKYGITGLRQIWAKNPAEIQAMSNNPVERVKMVDPLAQFPRTSMPIEMTEENATKFTQQAQAFLASKNLNADDRDRLILFVAINTDSNSQIDVSNPEIWNIAYRRLIELGCISSDEPNQSTLAPTRAPEPSADELAAEADSNYRDVALPLLSSWRSSLRANWGIELTDRLRDIAVDIMERHNLNPTLYESYDFVRIQMANRKLIRTDKTADGRPLTRSEFVADAIDRNNIDLSRPENKRWFMEQQDLILNGGE